MSDLAINVLVRPFVVLALFVAAMLIAWGLRRVIPEGRVKEALYFRREWSDWRFIALWLGFFALFV
jgi:hypothetical protein